MPTNYIIIMGSKEDPKLKVMYIIQWGNGQTDLSIIYVR